MIRRVFFVALALCVLGFGPVAPQEDNPERTSKFYNGRWWGNGINIKNGDAFSPGLRGGYVEGLIDGLGFAALCDPTFASLSKPPLRATNGEIAEQLDSFYADPANRRIPIVNVLLIAKMRFDGASNEAIERELVRLRKASASTRD